MTEPSPIKVVFLLFPNVTQLDLTGPAQVLSKLGNCQIELVWKHLDPVITDAGFSILPTSTLKDTTSADILCIPGGFGTLDVMQDEDVLRWIKHISQSARWITSVCTGSLVLGAAGLLKGYKATTHWASMEQLSYFGAIPTKQRIVFDRNRVTGAGVTSGIDFSLALAAKIRGDAHAKLIQLSIEYDPEPPFQSGSPESATDDALNGYTQIVNQRSPGRAQTVKAIAARLGF